MPIDCAFFYRRHYVVAVLFQPLFIYRDLDGVSSETVDSVNKNYFKSPRSFAVGQHFLKSRTIVVRARHRFVDVTVDDIQSVVLSVFVTYP